MLMLSEIRRFRLVDEQNRMARLADLSVDLLDGDEYPAIKRLLFYNDKNEFVGLAWSEVRDIELKNKQLRVTNFDKAHALGEQTKTKQVLLARDVLDALVLDLQHRRATRANDLWLEKDNDKLLLTGADVSLAAIFRRLTFNRWRFFNKEDLYDWKYVEFLRGNPESARSGAAYQSRINKLAPGEIAQFIDWIPYLHAAELIILLPDDLAADVLELASPEKQLQIFEELSDVQSQEMLGLLAPETATNILKQLESKTAQRILETLPKEASAKIIELLKYPEGTVGSIMTNDFVSVPQDLSIEEARQYLSEPLKKPNFVYLVYAVESEQSKCLHGVISLRELVTAEPEKKVCDVMKKHITILSPMDSASAAAYRLIDSHLAAMPVINEKNEIVGVVTVDAAVSAVAPRNWRDQAPRVFN